MNGSAATRFSSSRRDPPVSRRQVLGRPSGYAYFAGRKGDDTEPLLYLSLYFKENRAEYYECLQRVRFDGDWEQWLRFFMRGVLEVSQQAVETAKKLLALVDTDRARIRAELKVSSSSALRVLDALARRPITSAKSLALESAISDPDSPFDAERSARSWNRCCRADGSKEEHGLCVLSLHRRLKKWGSSFAARGASPL